MEPIIRSDKRSFDIIANKNEEPIFRGRSQLSRDPKEIARNSNQSFNPQHYQLITPNMSLLSLRGLQPNNRLSSFEKSTSPRQQNPNVKTEHSQETMTMKNVNRNDGTLAGSRCETGPDVLENTPMVTFADQDGVDDPPHIIDIRPTQRVAKMLPMITPAKLEQQYPHSMKRSNKARKSING